MLVTSKSPLAVATRKDSVGEETSAVPGSGSKSVTNGCACTDTTPASVLVPASMSTGFGALLYDGGMPNVCSSGQVAWPEDPLHVLEKSRSYPRTSTVADPIRRAAVVRSRWILGSMKL